LPHSLSAQKRVRQDEKRRLRTRAVRSSMKTYTKKLLSALEAGDADQARTEYRAASRAIDKAVTRGALHKRTGARQKSRLAARLSRLAAATAES